LRDHRPDLGTNVIIPLAYCSCENRTRGVPCFDYSVTVSVNNAEDRDTQMGADMPAYCRCIIADADYPADVRSEQAVQVMPGVIDEKYPALLPLPQIGGNRSISPYRPALAPDTGKVMYRYLCDLLKTVHFRYDPRFGNNGSFLECENDLGSRGMTNHYAVDIDRFPPDAPPNRPFR